MLNLNMGKFSNNNVRLCTSNSCASQDQTLYVFVFVSSCLKIWVHLFGCICYNFLFAANCTKSQCNLFSVIYKVLTYLRSPNWDTRIAAGQAVEAIVKNIPEWKPAPKPKEGEHLCLLIKIFK